MMHQRHLRILIYRWRWLILIGIALYSLTILRRLPPTHRQSSPLLDEEKQEEDDEAIQSERLVNEAKRSVRIGDLENLPVKLAGYDFSFVEILGDEKLPLVERMNANVDVKAKPKLIVSWNAGHTADNLRGCPEWNCEFSLDRQRIQEADAILMASPDHLLTKRRKDQYVVYFNQESPINSPTHFADPDYFNMTLSFRRDDPAGSPYGYVVRLAPESYRRDPLVDHEAINKKHKSIAWFVSHCSTISRREAYVQYLKIHIFFEYYRCTLTLTYTVFACGPLKCPRGNEMHIDVDVYGACGPLKCPRGDNCETMLNTDYYFYITFENSICKHYITEKLWSLGLSMEIIPIVLKRSIVQPFVPPHSFIAVDDFATVKELADYLHFLIANRTAYLEYFDWRRQYKVIFLNGRVHDALEKPWGFCQVCRLMWQKPRPQIFIPDFTQWWSHTCEGSELVDEILEKSGDPMPIAVVENDNNGNDNIHNIHNGNHNIRKIHNSNNSNTKKQ